LKIIKGTQLLCLRFADIKHIDTISKHKEMIIQRGYVWFGKIGSKPSEESINKMIENDSRYIILKDSKRTFICEFEEYTTDANKVDYYPAYYDSEILTSRIIKIWFKLTSVIQVVEQFPLDSIVLKNTRRPLLEAVKVSMSPMFHTVTIRDFEI